MKCPDCGFEVEELKSSTGTCKSCYIRLTNAKHRGKEYIPLISLKGTKKYEKALNQRGNTNSVKDKSKKVKDKVKKVKDSVNKEDDFLKDALSKISKEVEEELKDTLQKEMSKRGVEPITNTISLAYILPHMYDLFQDNNLITQRVILDAIYENQIVDSLHILKQAGKDDILLDTRVGSRQRQLQELRTPNHYELELYSCYKDFITAIKENAELMKLLEESNAKFERTLDNQKNPIYSTNSEFMKNFDFVKYDDLVKDKKLIYNNNIQTMKYKYRVRIKNCKGLFGDPTPQTFYYKDKNSEKETYIEAPTVEDAKNIVKALMRNYFSSVKYSPTDIEVITWDEHLKQQKECL